MILTGDLRTMQDHTHVLEVWLRYRIHFLSNNIHDCLNLSKNFSSVERCFYELQTNKMVQKYLAFAAIALVKSVSGASFSLPLTWKTSPSEGRHVFPGRRGTAKAFEFSYEVTLFLVPYLPTS
jgi:hypothetical protein